MKGLTAGAIAALEPDIPSERQRKRRKSIETLTIAAHRQDQASYPDSDAGISSRRFEPTHASLRPKPEQTQQFVWEGEKSGSSLDPRGGVREDSEAEHGPTAVRDRDVRHSCGETCEYISKP